MKKGVILGIFVLLLILPSVFADFDAFGIVRHNFYDSSNTSLAYIERQEWVRMEREGLGLEPANIQFVFDIVNISSFNELGSVDEFGDVNIDKVEVECVQWYELNDITDLVTFSDPSNPLGSATEVVRFQETYDESNTPVENEFVSLPMMSDTTAKCTTRTYYQGISGRPERLDSLSTTSEVMIIPSFDSEYCPFYSVEDSNYNTFISFVTGLVELVMSFWLWAYWILKIVIYAGILGFVIYSVILAYYTLKGIVGNLQR